MVQQTTGTAPGDSTATGGGAYSPYAVGSAVGDSSAPAKSTIILTEVSQAAGLTAVAGPATPRVSMAAMLVLGTRPAHYEYMTQLAGLTLTAIRAREERVSEYVSETLVQGKVVEQVSQLAQLTLARTDPAKRQLRAFSFNMDGHSFYVLHMGDLGTVVFDQTTNKWSEWQTFMDNVWRANYGINWNGDIIAGSAVSNLVYTVSPTEPMDERTLPIVSTVTGAYPVRMRASIACDEIMVTTSVGMGAQQPGVASTLELRISDDWGMSFRSAGVLDMSTAQPSTQVSWRSLGQMSAPGRIFQLIDNGAALRINSIEMYSSDVQDG